MPPQDWTSNILFEGLKREQLQFVEPFICKKSFPENSMIMNEGEEGNFVFMISEGSVHIYKDELKLSTATRGDLVGLMSLFDSEARSATVIAGEGGVAGYEMKKEGLTQILNGNNHAIANKLLLNYLKYQQSRVRNTNELSLKEAREKLKVEKKRVMSAHFFAQMVLGLVIFTFLLGFLNAMTKQFDSTYISFGLLGSYAIWSFFYVRNSGLPLSVFGMEMKNFASTIRPVLFASLVFICFLIALKAFLIYFLPAEFGSVLIEFYEHNDGGLAKTSFIILMYAIHSVFQEFVARGCIQGGLMQFIGGKWAEWKSIILAALMFSSFHMMIDVKYAIMTIVPGIFWGYLFYKYPNILSVSISHIMIGIVAIFLLNLL